MCALRTGDGLGVMVGGECTGVSGGNDSDFSEVDL
jgi:hypothetical protein